MFVYFMRDVFSQSMYDFKLKVIYNITQLFVSHVDIINSNTFTETYTFKTFKKIA